MLADFDEQCSKEDDWDVDTALYYDPGIPLTCHSVYKKCLRTFPTRFFHTNYVVVYIIIIMVQPSNDSALC